MIFLRLYISIGMYTMFYRLWCRIDGRTHFEWYASISWRLNEYVLYGCVRDSSSCDWCAIQKFQNTTKIHYSCVSPFCLESVLKMSFILRLKSALWNHNNVDHITKATMTPAQEICQLNFEHSSVPINVTCIHKCISFLAHTHLL